ncbi:hypothetical protein BU24DRAFT_424462 [Aaosphaeria arxii CBS 175.79]|uniref:Zn(2)-C6 fungal-type domain-containing protein n=1 Tax=Aaosphaeria arxii CBS 175.79 TaxID=1450172 RepID=A0A6A5XL40_9PLEO|nr:uncharacterized protein BU24DRAFT_424462 [Aaosphaeria arxii CBS 175.79]KAF2013450.1 hypothetical protein BU24DRAFT_424462 [Aaosphaeria arxii CBS 175.79]
MSSESDRSRRRAACDECRFRKVKCSGSEPCVNCQNDQCPCIYSSPKPPGRPRKRTRTTGEACFPTEDTPSASTATPFDYSELYGQDSFLDIATDYLPEVQSNIPPPPNTAIFPHVTIPVTTPCTCLSLAYLTITRIQFPSPTLNDLSSSLADLHSALISALTILRCTQCPRQMATAMQNLYQLSTLLHSIVGRIQTILVHVDASANPRASSPHAQAPEQPNHRDQQHQSQPSPFPPPPSPSILFPGHDTTTMTRHQFRVFFRKFLRDTVLGPPTDTGDTTLMGIMHQFEKRQERWHEDPHMYEEQAKMFGKRTATVNAHDCQSRVCYVLIERIKVAINELDL